jgi:hypothetical protein
MGMAILLHEGLCWTYPTSICHVLPHSTTGRLVGPAKKANPGEQFFRFVSWFSHQAGNAHCQL